MKGYKVFNSDWTCRDFQYEVGKTYKMDKKPVPCECGFHFCKRAADCFNYYKFDQNNKVAEVEAVGEIERDGDKCCTNEIKIIKEIPWCEVLNLVNIGEDCTGLKNTGNRNTGNRNTGDCNIGSYNTGNGNTSFRNTGDFNTGRWNTGNHNTGDLNTGNRNTGDRNTGDCNIGDWNIGDWNSTSYSGGCFNTEMGKIRLFNKPSIWTLEDWQKSKACSIMSNSPHDAVIWKPWVYMSDEEKQRHPESEITGGCLTNRTKREANMQKWWDGLDEYEKEVVMAIPNFDADIFKECTGIEVCKR